MTYTGTVIKEMVNAGSKSEHEAVILETAQGKFKLRRLGGNPFQDSVLDQLVGKTVEVEGNLLGGGSLMLTTWKTI